VRGQLYDNRLSTLSWSGDQWNYNRGAILNWYDSTSGYSYQNPNSGSDNNGNVLRSEVWLPNDRPRAEENQPDYFTSRAPVIG
jgi:hypothetical protein